MLSFEDKYRIILKKDISYEGMFYTSVKTTGIFCLPSCSAKKPFREDVLFFDDVMSALASGYRPCKICNPMVIRGRTPAKLLKLITHVLDCPEHVIKEYHLKQEGLDPQAVRRWFLNHHGLTFSAFQRMLRINHNFIKLSSGAVLNARVPCSVHNSLKTATSIDCTRLETPLGPMYACAVPKGICLLEFTDRRMLETELKQLEKFFKSKIKLRHNPLFDELQKQLTEYFEGKRINFDIPLVTPGSSFEQKVWQQLVTIPYGATRSYKKQSILLGQPEAIRAVARANGMNPVSILVPCHRVLGSNGQFTGYGGGIWRKKWLLDLENKSL